MSAGSACPLHANSSALVKQRVESLFAKIKEHPVPVISGPDYVLADYRLIKSGMFLTLYSPFVMFPLFAQALAALENGDGRLALAIWKGLQPIPKCNAPPSLFPTNKREAQLAVMCGEAEGVKNTLPEIAKHLKDQAKISGFGDILADVVRVSCA